MVRDETAAAKGSVPYSRPDLSSKELDYIQQCLASGSIGGDGPFTNKCHEFLKGIYGATVMLTHSCTASLEAAAILADLQPGDEVIMPSFTFVSTANAVVLRGAIPVFVDVRPDTLNIDETLIEAAITPKTRAIMPVHYAGVGAEMRAIMKIATEHRLIVIEDAAQGMCARFDGQALGTFGQLGCLSFHETKNVVSGEGGALIVNDPGLVNRAYHVREKGTNRTEFLRREVTKYEWIDIGSSYLPSDLLAAVLLAQLERSLDITSRRVAIWKRFHAAFTSVIGSRIRLTAPPSECDHNGHIYFMVGPDADFQQNMLKRLKADGISATSHYVPLHSAPAGRKYGRTAGRLPVTDHSANALIRFPLYSNMSDQKVDYIIERTIAHVRAIN